jgi:hypothetical protein
VPRGTRIHSARHCSLSLACRVQREGGPVEEIRPGDIVWFEAGERYWHGAPPDCAMTHIVIAEMRDGKAVDWMDKVTAEQYGGAAQ